MRVRVLVVAAVAAAVGSALAPPVRPVSAASHTSHGPHASQVSSVSSGQARAVTWDTSDPEVAFVVSDQRISEASGLAVSRRHRGVVYTHNDSGGDARIFAVGADGSTRATFTIVGADTRDWEAMAPGRDAAGRPVLFIADIGDNLDGAWPSVTVYRVPEPAQLRDQTLRATVFRMRYADGARNAETLLVNPVTGRLYVASKEFSGGLYAAPARLRTDRTNVLRQIGRVPALATDGAYAPDGRSFVIRTYFAAHVYAAPGRLLAIVSLPSQTQGESIGFSADGRALLVGSEGVRQPVYRVPLPEDARPTPRPSPSRSTATPQGAAGRDSESPRTLVLLAVAIGGVITYRLARRRSASGSRR